MRRMRGRTRTRDIRLPEVRIVIDMPSATERCNCRGVVDRASRCLVNLKSRVRRGRSLEEERNGCSRLCSMPARRLP